MSGHPSWNQVDTARAGLFPRGATCKGLIMAKGSRSRHSSRQEVMPQEGPLQLSGPSGSHLLHVHSSLSTFLRISRLTQNCRTLRDQNFRFQKGETEAQRQAASTLRPQTFGVSGSRSQPLGLQSRVCNAPQSTPWRQTHECNGFLMKSAN